MVREAQNPRGGSEPPYVVGALTPCLTPAVAPQTGRPELRLQAWLAGLKARGVGIAIEAGGLVMTGERWTVMDRKRAEAWEHALRLAAAGTHPAWWAAVTGRSSTPPTLEELPTVDDPTSADGLAFPCARCGAPADLLDGELLGWCAAHGTVPA